MSLLADLLSKIKPPRTATDIPPNLRNIVQSSARKSVNRRRTVLLSVLFATAVLTGFFVVYLTKSLPEKSAGNIRMSPRERAVTSEQAQVAAHMTNDNKDKPFASPVGAGFKPAPFPEQKEKPAETVKPSGPDEKALKAPDMLPGPEQVIVRQESPALQFKQEAGPSQDAWLYSARELEMRNDYQGAIGYYKKILEADSDNFKTMNNIAYLYLKMGLTEEAVKYSRMSLEVNRDYVPALINMGIASAKSGNLADAEERLTHALELDPDNQDILFNLALLYEKQTDYPRASGYFSRLAGSGSVSGSLGLARVHEKQGNTEEALKLYRTAYADSSIDDKTRADVKRRIILLSGKPR
ncbi:MAG: hypothetical protein C4526_01215 [Nitrospiraceae bacterium]|nr:MAG: hypothetical protein C4526_01215 [Nitrospiraceae bacterium]